MVGTHFHLASGVGSILHQAILVSPAMVHQIVVGSPCKPASLKVVGTEGLGKAAWEEQWTNKLPQIWPLEGVHLLMEAIACGKILYDSS